MPELNEWESKGFARAIALCTKSQTPTEYPTLDKNTVTDEQDFIRGFNLGIKEFNQGNGVMTCAAYLQETAEKNL